MKKLASAMLCLTAWLHPEAASAKFGAPDKVPAATLLLPYFEVNLDDPDVISTLFTIRNTSKSVVLTKVTLWTDLNVPTIAFDVYMPGYGQQSVDLWELFERGTLPQSGRDHPFTTRGAFSDPNVLFPNCLPEPTLAAPSNLTSAEVGHIQAAHRGLASPLFADQCSARALDTAARVVRGSVTVDVVNQCSGRGVFPGSNGYFPAGTGIAGKTNALTGEYWIVESVQNFSFADSLVHIEAEPPPDPGPAARTQLGPGVPTFYGSLVGFDASDAREPLGKTWGARFDTTVGRFERTELIVWRDPGGPVAPFACGNLPGPFPLGQGGILVHDLDGVQQNAGILQPFPAASGRTRVGGASFPVPVTAGTLVLELDPDGIAEVQQSHVSVLFQSIGRYEIGYNGIQLESALAPPIRKGAATRGPAGRGQGGGSGQ